MPKLAKYTRLVDELEQGCLPPGLEDEEAINRLILQIIVAPWRTGDQRLKAQSLGDRLSKLKRTRKT